MYNCPVVSKSGKHCFLNIQPHLTCIISLFPFLRDNEPCWEGYDIPIPFKAEHCAISYSLNIDYFFIWGVVSVLIAVFSLIKVERVSNLWV